MKRTALFSVVALALQISAPANGAEPAGVRFRGLAEGMTEARSTGRPLLLFFTADWCPPCHEMVSGVFAVSHFVPLVEGPFVPVEVTIRPGGNSPEVEALLAATGVKGFPTLVVMHAEGIAAVREVGYASRQATMTFLKAAPGRLKAAEEKRRASSSP